MVPDKIFIQENDASMRYGINQSGGIKGMHAYIRKDALLTFLNERRKGLSSGDSFVAGERKMLKEIIEKIESL